MRLPVREWRSSCGPWLSGLLRRRPGRLDPQPRNWVRWVGRTSILPAGASRADQCRVDHLPRRHRGLTASAPDRRLWRLRQGNRPARRRQSRRGKHPMALRHLLLAPQADIPEPAEEIGVTSRARVHSPSAASLASVGTAATAVKEPTHPAARTARARSSAARHPAILFGVARKRTGHRHSLRDVAWVGSGQYATKATKRSRSGVTNCQCPAC